MSLNVSEVVHKKFAPSIYGYGVPSNSTGSVLFLSSQELKLDSVVPPPIHELSNFPFVLLLSIASQGILVGLPHDICPTI